MDFFFFFFLAAEIKAVKDDGLVLKGELALNKATQYTQKEEMLHARLLSLLKKKRNTLLYKCHDGHSLWGGKEGVLFLGAIRFKQV